MKTYNNEIRLENNPIEDVLWYWTLAKLGFKVVALVLFAIYCAIKIAMK